MKESKTLDYEDFDGPQFHVYGVLLTNNGVYYNEGNKQPLNSKKKMYIHAPTLKQWIYDLYHHKNLERPVIYEHFGHSTQVSWNSFMPYCNFL